MKLGLIPIITAIFLMGFSGCNVSLEGTVGEITIEDNSLLLDIISTEEGIKLVPNEDARYISLPSVPIGQINLSKPDSNHLDITVINSTVTPLFTAEYNVKTYRNGVIDVNSNRSSGVILPGASGWTQIITSTNWNYAVLSGIKLHAGIETYLVPNYTYTP
jgi:hypothetical protein